jgi:ribosomal-protein-alanine N-acetyltransferase
VDTLPEADARLRVGAYELGRLRPADLSQVLALERLVFPEPLGMRQLRRLYRRPEVTYIAAYREPGGVVAAYYGFERLPDGRGAHVLANVTHPAERRRGLGRALVTWGTQLGRERGVRWIVGEVRASNEAQLAFLATLGWRVGERMPRFFGDGEDAWMVYHCLP